MRPRTTYRLTCALVPAAVLMAVVGALSGTWLLVATMAIVAVGAVFNLRAMRRRGIDWHGPTTYRELRRRQRAASDD
jgi:hypothetical protein